MYQTAYNPTDSPVVVDDQGRSLGGGEWGTVDTTADSVEAAVAGGRLVLRPTPPPDSADTDRSALAAFGRTEEVAARAEQLQAIDKSELLDLARSAGVIVEDDEWLHKRDLVHRLAVDSSVSLPAAATSPEGPNSTSDVAGEPEDSPASASSNAAGEGSGSRRKKES